MRAIPGYISKSIRSVLVILPLVVMLMAIISCEKQYADDYGDETTNSFRGTEDQSDYTWSDSDIREIELKGSSANIGAKLLESACRTVEEKGKNGDSNLIEKDVANLLESAAKTRAEILDILKEY